MSTEENAALVRRLYELWNARDLEAALDLGTDDIEVTIVSTSQTLRGRDGFRRFMDRFAIAFPRMKKELSNQVSSRNQVVSEFRLEGRHDGPLAMPDGDVPPTGRLVHLSSIEVIGVRDGKVETIRNYSDSASLVRQLGLIE